MSHARVTVTAPVGLTRYNTLRTGLNPRRKRAWRIRSVQYWIDPYQLMNAAIAGPRWYLRALVLAGENVTIGTLPDPRRVHSWSIGGTSYVVVDSTIAWTVPATGNIWDPPGQLLTNWPGYTVMFENYNVNASMVLELDVFYEEVEVTAEQALLLNQFGSIVS